MIKIHGRIAQLPFFFHFHDNSSDAKNSEKISTAEALKAKYKESIDFTDPTQKEKKTKAIVPQVKPISLRKAEQSPQAHTQKRVGAPKTPQSKATRQRPTLTRAMVPPCTSKESAPLPQTSTYEPPREKSATTLPAVTKPPPLSKKPSAYQLPEALKVQAQKLVAQIEKKGIRSEPLDDEGKLSGLMMSMQAQRKSLRSSLDNLLRNGDSGSISHETVAGLKPIRALLSTLKRHFENQIPSTLRKEKNGIALEVEMLVIQNAKVEATLLDNSSKDPNEQEMNSYFELLIDAVRQSVTFR